MWGRREIGVEDVVHGFDPSTWRMKWPLVGRREDQELSSGGAKFEECARHPSGDTEKAAGDMKVWSLGGRARMEIYIQESSAYAWGF